MSSKRGYTCRKRFVTFCSRQVIFPLLLHKSHICFQIHCCIHNKQYKTKTVYFTKKLHSNHSSMSGKQVADDQNSPTTEYKWEAIELSSLQTWCDVYQIDKNGTASELAARLTQFGAKCPPIPAPQMSGKSTIPLNANGGNDNNQEHKSKAVDVNFDHLVSVITTKVLDAVKATLPQTQQSSNSSSSSSSSTGQQPLLQASQQPLQQPLPQPPQQPNNLNNLLTQLLNNSTSSSSNSNSSSTTNATATARPQASPLSGLPSIPYSTACLEAVTKGAYIDLNALYAANYELNLTVGQPNPRTKPKNYIDSAIKWMAAWSCLIGYHQAIRPD